MRVGTGIEDQNAGDLRRLLNPVNQLAFRIGLAKSDLHIWRSILHALVDILQRLVTIYLRLTCAEQVEIWAVQDKNLLCHYQKVLRRNAQEGKSVTSKGERQMQIFVNGDPRQLEAGMTVRELVLVLNSDPRAIAVERNLEIVPRAEHEVTVLHEGDRLEIVQFVGGG